MRNEVFHYKISVVLLPLCCKQGIAEFYFPTSVIPTLIRKSIILCCPKCGRTIPEAHNLFWNLFCLHIDRGELQERLKRFSVGFALPLEVGKMLSDLLSDQPCYREPPTDWFNMRVALGLAHQFDSGFKVLPSNQIYLKGAALECSSCSMVFPLHQSFAESGMITCPKCARRERTPKGLMKKLLETSSTINAAIDNVARNRVYVLLIPSDWTPPKENPKIIPL